MLNDRWLGVFAIGLSVFLFWFGHGLEAPFAYEPVGPRAFPMLLAAIICLCGLILLIKGGSPVAPNTHSANFRILLMVAIIAAYGMLFQLLGFIIATTLMTACVARLFGGTWLRSATAGILMGVIFFFLFDRLLDVVLPSGLLRAWL